MAAASLDYWRLRWVPPRGVDETDHPTFATPEGAMLRHYIWSRLLDSLRTDGLKFLEWMAILHNVFPFSGGAHELLARTRNEWPVIKSHINAGDPWPIGTIGMTTDPMHNHQVLAIGYDDPGNGTAVLYVYDSNAVNQVSQIDLDFRGTQLSTNQTAYPGGFNTQQGPVAGIFAEHYTQRQPPVAVAVQTSISSSPGTVIPLGQPIDLQYQAHNVGFGPSPAMRLYGVGRVVADGANVDAGASDPVAVGLAAGAVRGYERNVVLAGEAGLRRYQVGVSVEQMGAQRWRTLPGLHGVSTSIDVVVTVPTNAWASLGGGLVSPPFAIRRSDGRILAGAIGLDHCLWGIEQTANNGWGGWAALGLHCPPLVGQVSAAMNPDGRIEFVARAADGRAFHLWQNRPDGDDWSTWTPLDGATHSGDPVIIANQDGHLEVFAVDTSGRLLHNWQLPFNVAWSGWQDLGTGVMGRPAAGRHADGRVEVFVRMTTGAIWHAWQNSAGSVDWSRGVFGGNVTADLTVLSHPAGMRVFARDTGGGISMRQLSGGSWLGWTGLWGGFPSDGQAIPFADSAGIWVLSRGLGDAVWQHRETSAGTVMGWMPIGGGTIRFEPAIVANQDNRLELLAIGSDGTLVHRWQVSPDGDWNS
jgi:hypothetical protein